MDLATPWAWENGEINRGSKDPERKLDILKHFVLIRKHPIPVHILTSSKILYDSLSKPIRTNEK